VGVDAEGEGRIAVAEVFGQLLDGDATCQHDAGVVVAELVNAFLTGGGVVAPSAPVPDGCGNHPRLDQCWFPDGLGVVTRFDVLTVRVPPEQDVASVRLSGWLFPGQRTGLRRVSLDVPLNSPDSPVRQRDNSFAIVFRQSKYISLGELFHLPTQSHSFLAEVEIFHRDTE
jgi:hypothetical protein